ncbi:hypothetical protein GPECTOR_1g757 [Gonium pectorale]|uniref:Uncharacterized protein n=1 Tax=Gonium pectorale TaxID=33097 RepID=A0A150H3W5_GONPE|nr:hypothetical protein GPECTOR_1g757 [Gonium pectorale]|eukprot:KXZ56839.1 hypothetical protein GPECTOR_1g757 [Gonium pectorale]
MAFRQQPLSGREAHASRQLRQLGGHPWRSSPELRTGIAERGAADAETSPCKRLVDCMSAAFGSGDEARGTTQDHNAASPRKRQALGPAGASEVEAEVPKVGAWSPNVPRLRTQLQPQPLARLPSLALPRRWTVAIPAPLGDGTRLQFPTFTGAAASPAPPRHPAPPCHLLELPNELLLLIMLACVDPASAGGGGGGAALGLPVPTQYGSTPRAAPPSPGWSFALIAASPSPSPARAAPGRARRAVLGIGSPGGAGGSGGAGGGSSGGSGYRMSGSAGGAEADSGMAGLRAAACAAMTCRRLRAAYRLLCAARPDLELQAEAALRSLHEKRRLVRRLTITQHDAYVARELAAEGAAGVAVAAGVALLCGAFGACRPHGISVPVQTVANYAAFTVVHVLLHTGILAAAYRASAWLGTRRAMALGLAVLAGHYLLLVPAAKVLLSLPPVPPRLNLEPWHRSPDQPPPLYPVAALLWPLYGDGVHWRLIHLLSNGFAWAYGAYEWYHSFSCVRLRNGLRY